MRRVLLLLLVVGIVFVYRFGWVPSGVDQSDAVDSTAPASPTRKAPVATEAFSREGKTHRSAMRPSIETKLYLAHCPGVKIDGDNDGIPCESQWCSGDAE